MKQTTKTVPTRMGLQSLWGAVERLSLTLMFIMLTATTAWAEDVATATIDGNTYTYSSLESAISAANGAQSTATVTLLKDITEQPCSLEVRKPMIIDLNGHVVKNTNKNLESDLFYLKPGAGNTVTIKNGSVCASRKSLYVEDGRVVIENLTVENIIPTGYCIMVYYDATLTLSQCVSFKGVVFSKGTVQIADGQTLYDNDGNVYEGEYEGENGYAFNNKTLTPFAKLVVGGISTPYNSLKDAVSAANSAESAATVNLYQDITEQTCSLEVSKPMVIDLNGHTVNADNLPYAYGVFSILNNSGQVVIKNGTISRMGASGNFVYAIYNYCNDLVLENVTVKNTYSAANPCLFNNGTLTISKGITFVGSIDNSGTVQIASGQELYDKNGIKYSGNLNTSKVAALANNTLFPLITVTAHGITNTYNSLQDAVSAAANAYTTYGTAATITLNHDITEQPCSLEVRKPMIIDLNGHVVNADNLTYAYGIFSIMNAEGQVIIKNGTISRRGVNDYNGFAIYNYNSNVELENVTVKNTYSTDNPCLYNNGTLTISKNITLVGSINNSGTVQIAEGQLLGDASGKYYLGTLTTAQVDAIANNTLSVLAVPYIDAAGNTAHCADYKLLSTSNEAITLTTGWYVVDGKVTLSGIISLSGDVNIILCDGASLNVPFLKQEADIMDYTINTPEGDIAIYGQEAGTGALYCERMIYNQAGGITFNGGNVTIIDENFGCCIWNEADDLVVNGGTLYVCCHDEGGTGILQLGGAVIINGGTVNIDAYVGIGIENYNESRECVFDDEEEAASRAHTKRAASYNFNPKLVMNGGRLTINSARCGIGSIGGIDFNGGQLTALASGVNSYGINSNVNLNLSYTNTSDFFYASNVTIENDEYSPKIIVADGKTFYDGLGHSYSGNITDYADDLAGKILRPFDYLLLADNSDNASVIANHAGSTIPVALQGRTLYKDGKWNTIVLPFTLSADEIAASQLAGADIRTLNEASFSDADGELTLNFTPESGEGAVSSIVAGKPYIIKWDKPENYVAYNGKNAASCSDIVNPVFTGVTLDATNRSVSFDLETTEGQEKGVIFLGTYSPITWETETKSILFLGNSNTLYFPQPSGDKIPHLNAFRAYFQLDGLTAGEVTLARMSFEGDSSETTIISPAEIKEMAEISADAWYTVNGVKLDGKPCAKGMYIKNGKKVVIK